MPLPRLDYRKTVSITKYHRLDDLQTTESNYSQFQGLEVQDQGASLVW